MQAFGTVGPVETAYYRETGKQLLLSEQNLMDCGWYQNNKACFGGYQVCLVFDPIYLSAAASLFSCCLSPTDVPFIGCLSLELVQASQLPFGLLLPFMSSLLVS